MANFCSNCGNALSPENKFCPNCGTAVSSVTPGAPLSEPQAQQNQQTVGNPYIPINADYKQLKRLDLGVSKEPVEQQVGTTVMRMTTHLKIAVILNFIYSGMALLSGLILFFNPQEVIAILDDPDLTDPSLIQTASYVVLIFGAVYAWATFITMRMGSAGRRVLIILSVILGLTALVSVNILLIVLAAYTIYVLMIDADTKLLFRRNEPQDVTQPELWA